MIKLRLFPRREAVRIPRTGRVSGYLRGWNPILPTGGSGTAEVSNSGEPTTAVFRSF